MIKERIQREILASARKPRHRSLILYAGRSLFPILALIAILSTFLWGPWMMLVFVIISVAAMETWA